MFVRSVLLAEMRSTRGPLPGADQTRTGPLRQTSRNACSRSSTAQALGATPFAGFPTSIGRRLCVALVAERNTSLRMLISDGSITLEAATGDQAQASEAIEAVVDQPEGGDLAVTAAGNRRASPPGRPGAPGVHPGRVALPRPVRRVRLGPQHRLGDVQPERTQLKFDELPTTLERTEVAGRATP